MPPRGDDQGCGDHADGTILYRGNFLMRDTQKITEVTVSTKSTEPLSGIVQIDTAASTMKFEVNAEVAHDLCTHLDRFLTQGMHAPDKVRHRR